MRKRVSSAWSAGNDRFIVSKQQWMHTVQLSVVILSTSTTLKIPQNYNPFPPKKCFKSPQLTVLRAAESCQHCPNCLDL